MKNIKAIILAVILFAGVGVVYGAWTNAPANPPNNNVEAPINVGSIGQTKTGDLTISTVLTSLHVITKNLIFNPTTDPDSGQRQGKVLTAIDNSGTVAWKNLSSAVTGIFAGKGISVSSNTGNVTITNDTPGMRPVEIGMHSAGQSYSYGSDWKLIQFSGQSNVPVGGGGSSDSSPAGGYITKSVDSNGNTIVQWVFYTAQGEMNTSGGNINGAGPKNANLKAGPEFDIEITVANGVPTIRLGSRVQLAYVSLN